MCTPVANTITREEAVATTVQVGADLLARQAKTNTVALYNEDQNTRMANALNAVTDLHRPVLIAWANKSVCSHCYTNTPLVIGDPWSGMAGRVTYPCPTIEAITGQDN